MQIVKTKGISSTVLIRVHQAMHALGVVRRFGGRMTSNPTWRFWQIQHALSVGTFLGFVWRQLDIGDIDEERAQQMIQEIGDWITACETSQPLWKVWNTGLMVQLTESVQAEIAAHGGAKRCSYCGLVYLSPMLQYGSRLGFWDSAVRGQGWT
ncbi:hypothetical protein ABNM01_10965 [Pseudomonas syringae]|uniref:hypothetical protein n=1 Tax=Pseudomonas coronafaciens TaxID=53409 RepID=UPI000EFFA3E7|nr:hypothetical protein [Pseudomonas coronafaciens]RMV70587.1 hypothetical protein ALP06_200168 [Pseudomonas coronafaciens pv. atropurpurea]